MLTLQPTQGGYTCKDENGNNLNGGEVNTRDHWRNFAKARGQKLREKEPRSVVDRQNRELRDLVAEVLDNYSTIIDDDWIDNARKALGDA